MISGIGANYNIALQTSAAKSVQNSTPTFAHNHTWGSIGEMDSAWRKYTQEWKSVYADSFSGSGAEGDGKISLEELDELLQSEFGGMGVQFVDGVDIENPKAGRYEVYIDQANRQKMADDPEYRANVFAVIQSEMGGSKGYSVQTAAGTHNDRTTGLSMSIAEGNPLYEGVPHSAGGTSASNGVMFATSSGGPEKGGKSVLEQIKENLEKRLEEKKEREKLDAAKKARQDILELSIEAAAKIKSDAVENAGAANEKTVDDDEEETAGGGLDILA